MPELPEVETMVRDLAPRIVGRRIEDVEAAFPGIVKWPPLFEEFAQRLAGRTIAGIDRRGKYALIRLDSGETLSIHRGMTGSLLLRRSGDPRESHIRILFRLDCDWELRFTDPRKFGNVLLLGAGEGEPGEPWARMGPEPLEDAFTARVLRARLQGRTARIKPLLLDQRIVAGLGNIYVDEALHLARIHPLRRADTLTPAEIRRLHGAIKQVLGQAVEGRGTTFSSYADIEGRAGRYQQQLRVFHRTGSPCARCSAPIERLVVAGRGTHVCPRCQRI